MIVGDVLQCFDGSGASPQVHTEYSGGSRRHHATDGFRIQVVGVFANVGEDRRDLLPLQRVRGGNEGVRRYDDLAPQVEGSNGDFESDCAVAHGNAMAYAKIFCDLALELLSKGPVVGEPLPLEDVASVLHESLVASNVRATDRQGLPEHRRGAVAGRSRALRISFPRHTGCGGGSKGLMANGKAINTPT